MRASESSGGRPSRRRRGLTRTAAWMDAALARCVTDITREHAGVELSAGQMRAAIVVRLREAHACAFGQIGKALGVSRERVRQLYAAHTGVQSSHQEAPVYELSPRAIRALKDAGLEEGASLRDITLLMPMLHLAAKRPGEAGFNAAFHVHHVDRVTLREIEQWLGSKGIAIEP